MHHLFILVPMLVPHGTSSDRHLHVWDLIGPTFVGQTRETSNIVEPIFVVPETPDGCQFGTDGIPVDYLNDDDYDRVQYLLSLHRDQQGNPALSLDSTMHN